MYVCKCKRMKDYAVAEPELRPCVFLRTPPSVEKRMYVRPLRDYDIGCIAIENQRHTKKTNFYMY